MQPLPDTKDGPRHHFPNVGSLMRGTNISLGSTDKRLNEPLIHPSIKCHNVVSKQLTSSLPPLPILTTFSIPFPI